MGGLRSSNDWVAGSDDALGEGGAEAIKDFALQLKFWGKESLDEEAFDMLLDDIGYIRDREGLFDNFLREVGFASPSFDHAKRSISVQDMTYLYQSEPYRLPQQVAFNNGEALMSYVENLFRKADVTGDNVLDLEELRVFMGSLFDGREPTDNELSEVRDCLVVFVWDSSSDVISLYYDSLYRAFHLFLPGNESVRH